MSEEKLTDDQIRSLTQAMNNVCDVMKEIEKSGKNELICKKLHSAANLLFAVIRKSIWGVME